MNKIKLDPKKLLGFKIVADGSAAKLSSPKIGGKADATYVTGAALQAKIGTKLP